MTSSPSKRDLSSRNSSKQSRAPTLCWTGPSAFAQQNLAKAPPSLGQLARGMLKSPAMRRMVTSLAVGMEGAGGLLGMDEKLKLGGGEAADEELAAQLDEMLQSEGFADLVDRVVSTPAILAAVDDAAHTGTAPKAADLLPAITEAVCAGSGLSAAECAEVEKSAADRLNRLGFLEGDGAGGVLWKAIERLAYFAARLGASGLGGALVLAPVVALLLALFLTFIVRALAHNLQRLFGRKKRRRKRD